MNNDFVIRIKRRFLTFIKTRCSFFLKRQNRSPYINPEVAEVAMSSLAAMSQVPEKFSATEIKNFYENIIAKLPCIIVWKDRNLKYVFCNEITALDYLKLSSPSEIIGKTDFELGFNFEAAQYVRQVDEQIVTTGKPALDVEITFEMDDGRIVHLSTNRMPLFDSANEIIGIIGVSVDISVQKEAERREAELQKLEKDQQRAILQEKEKLITLAHKVAHDISSPLSALSMMVQLCNELPENKRTVIKRAMESILDIANNLLSTYRNEKPNAGLDSEPRQPVLISDLISQLLSEKKAQYSNLTVRMEADIPPDAQFAFAHLQASQFRRSFSNLINNSVDALAGSDRGQVTVRLDSDVNYVMVTIHDNGQGMPGDLVDKIMQRHPFTEGKHHGHGLGLQQVWDTLDQNQGTIGVHSIPGQGTTIQLTFPRISAPDWCVQTLALSPSSMVVILDDEESIHGAWDTRFAPYLQSCSKLTVHHFKQGQAVLDFLCKLTSLEKNRVIFLSDYELLGQNKNGLQIIEESGIKDTIMVTSYYANFSIKEKAIRLGIKILPKQMASIIDISITV
ncbi:MAG: putative Histidine kinase [Solimicrobium sp.]|jgi:signal transduction histidine kinase|nr:putative Histidine kinase [Solimicrobium sp.]